MNVKKVCLVAASAGLIVAAPYSAHAGNSKSAPAPARPAAAPRAAPSGGGMAHPGGGGMQGGASGGHPLAGGTAAPPGRGGAHALTGNAAAPPGGGAHALSGNAAAPPGGGAHALNGAAPPGGGAFRPEPGAAGVGREREFGGPPRGPEIGGRPEERGRVVGERFGDRAAERPGERLGERPGFAPGVRLVGAAAVGAAGALAYHHLAEHREAFAHDFGPGHEAVRDRAFLHDHEHDFHTRDVRRFDERELRAWRDGRWHQDWHYGRWGWWYDVGDVWYPYDAPVYPYPVEVSEVVVPDATMVAEGPGVIAGSAAPAGYVPGPVAIRTMAPGGVEVVIRPLPPAPVVNYRCPTPDGLYPAVHLCPAVWAVVP